MKNFTLYGYDPNRFINEVQINKLIFIYKQLLTQHPILKLEAEDSFEFIHRLKRVVNHIGPYNNLSLFEIANRLYSDLVVLEGSQKIFQSPSDYGLETVEGIRPLLSNINGFDITIQTTKGLVFGEAFNVAPSYFQPKVRDTMKKLNREEGVKTILVFNKEALNDKNLNFLLNQKQMHPNLIGYVICELDQWKLAEQIV